MDNQMLFVCGFPSGGTDLLKTVLNAHPEIYLNGEMPLLHTLNEQGYSANTQIKTVEQYKEIRSFFSKTDIWGNCENLDIDIDDYLRSHKSATFGPLLKHLFSTQERSIWGNKTPQNTENMKALHQMFPEAKFLVLVRDVRDVCLSWHKKWGKDRLWCAEKWNQRMTKGWNAAQSLPAEQSLFVRYESLLLETEAFSHSVCQFLGIPFSKQMLNHHEHTSERIDGKLNYGQKILKPNFNKWERELTEAEIKRIEEIAFSGLTTFNYGISQATQAKPISVIEKGKGFTNDALGMIFVGNQASSQNTLTKRLRATTTNLYKTIQK
ncbi:MAG: sulfotransferase [Chloroflexota bacterium]